MTLSLVRVDDRLVHGQVVVGWAQALGAQRVVMIDDAIRASDWEQELYTLGMPPGLPLDIVSVAEAAAQARAWITSPERTIVVTANVDTVARLCEAAPEIKQVNVGGMHAGSGREERLPYVFISPSEADTLRKLEARGVSVTAQDVPTAKPVTLKDLVGVAA